MKGNEVSGGPRQALKGHFLGGSKGKESLILLFLVVFQGAVLGGFLFSDFLIVG